MRTTNQNPQVSILSTQVKFRRDETGKVIYQSNLVGIVGSNAVELAMLQKGVARRNILSVQTMMLSR